LWKEFEHGEGEGQVDCVLALDGRLHSLQDMRTSCHVVAQAGSLAGSQCRLVGWQAVSTS